MRVAFVLVVATLALATTACGGAKSTPKPLVGVPPTVGVSSTTSTTLLTHIGRTSGDLVQHIWGTQSILVPVGWVEHDDIPGGSSDSVTFQDPNTPAMLVVTMDRCALCGSTSSGRPQPSNYLPETGITGTQILDPYRLAYEQNSTIPGYQTNGLFIDLRSGTTPNGTTTAAVTLPEAQHSLATTILNSLVAS
jgi:hypothetical protein